jgi:SAM-dependent methyltransferase
MPIAKARSCPACRSTESRTTGEVNGFRMQICAVCKTVFTADLPSSAGATDYAAYYHAGNLEVPCFVHQRLDQLVASFDRYRALNRWLDVGCGAGALMDATRKTGWNVIGTEVARAAADTVRARGFDVRMGELDALQLPAAGFDVVSMIEVVEHVPQATALLATARGLLRAGGVLYITTPHARGVSGRLLQMNWSVVSPPEHLQLFSVRGLRTAVSDAGLAVRTVRTHAVNPRELIQAVGSSTDRIEPGTRVENAYRLNESLSSTRVGALFKGAANVALNATRLGDSIRLVAERPV